MPYVTYGVPPRPGFHGPVNVYAHPPSPAMQSPSPPAAWQQAFIRHQQMPVMNQPPLHVSSLSLLLMFIIPTFVDNTCSGSAWAERQGSEKPGFLKQVRMYY